MLTRSFRRCFFLTGVVLLPGLLPAQPFQATVLGPWAASGQAVACADLNGDGSPDVLTYRASTLGLWLNDTQGGLLPPVTLHPSNVHSLAAGDVDGNGWIDLVIDDGQIHWLRGLGGGQFELHAVAADLQGASLPRSISLGDFDEDGNLDLLISDNSGFDAGAVDVYLGNGMGGFTVLPTQPAPEFIHVEAVADLDRDGHQDLVVYHGGPFGGWARVHLGVGDGTFDDVPATANLGAAIMAADFNEDGVFDLVSAVGDGDVACTGSLQVSLGDGAGAFLPLPPIAVYCAASPTAVADLDRDGHADLVDLSYPGLLELRFGDGQGNLGLPVTIPGMPSLVTMATDVDFDQDGHPDLVAIAQGGSLFIALNAAADPLFVRGDVDGDGLVGLFDVFLILGAVLIPGSPVVHCRDGMDVNDDGQVNLADPVRLLNFVFLLGSPVPEPPFPACGLDPTADGLPVVCSPGC